MVDTDGDVGAAPRAICTGDDRIGPKALGDRGVLVGIEELVADHDHVVLGDGGVQQADDRVVEVVAQIDAEQFGTDARGQPADRRCERSRHQATSSRRRAPRRAAPRNRECPCPTMIVYGAPRAAIDRADGSVRRASSDRPRSAAFTASLSSPSWISLAWPTRCLRLLRVAFVVRDLGRGHRRPLGDRRPVGRSPASSRGRRSSFCSRSLGSASPGRCGRRQRCRSRPPWPVLSLLQTSEASNLGPLADRHLHRARRDAGVARRGAHPARRTLRWPVAALVVVAAESVSLRASETPIRAIIAMSMLVLLGTATAAVVYIRLRDSERRTSIENARYNERLDLARELHDVVGHHVTGIVVLAQANRFTSGADPGSAADRALADIEAAGVETLTSVRRLIGLLRTDPSTATGPRLTDVEQHGRGSAQHPSVHRPDHRRRRARRLGAGRSRYHDAPARAGGGDERTPSRRPTIAGAVHDGQQRPRRSSSRSPTGCCTPPSTPATGWSACANGSTRWAARSQAGAVGDDAVEGARPTPD